MILKASQRGGANQLANHLLRTDENEHVEIHEIRGFVADDLKGALKEIHAQSLGTKCKQFMFSVSLNPPQNESVSVEVFEAALEKIEKKMGLQGQPRAVVFHEKEGRRHAHCVWSRIRAEQMNAVQLSHFKLKLQDVSREIYLENGWNMPKGFSNKQERDPLTFNRAEYHQAKRVQEDPKALKAMFQECWQGSDNRASFAQALKEKGYTLACGGEKRSFVAVDYRGEVYSLSRWTGAKTKELKARLGDPATLPGVGEVKSQMAKVVSSQLKQYAQDVTQKSRQALTLLKEEKQKLAERQRQDRQLLKEIQTKRVRDESRERKARIPSGWRKVWKGMTGEYREIRRQNAREIEQCKQRDREQRQALIDHQREERQALQQRIVDARQVYQGEMNELKEYMGHYAGMRSQDSVGIKSEFQRVAEAKEQEASQQDRGRELRREFNP